MGSLESLRRILGRLCANAGYSTRARGSSSFRSVSTFGLTRGEPPAVPSVSVKTPAPPQNNFSILPLLEFTLSGLSAYIGCRRFFHLLVVVECQCT